jgi:hypothetical protein
MRADTKQKHKMGKRFALVIGVAAAGVMALGAQTAAAKTYNTKLTIFPDRCCGIFGSVTAGGGKKCEVGRLVTLFKQKPGADRKLGAVRSDRVDPGWYVRLPAKAGWSRYTGWHIYAEATPKVGDGFVCSGDRSPIYTVPVIPLEAAGLRE